MIRPPLSLLAEDPAEPLDNLIERGAEVLTLASRGDSTGPIHVHDDLDLSSVPLVGVDDLGVGGPTLELGQRPDLALRAGEDVLGDLAVPLGDGDPHVPTFALGWNSVALAVESY
jgi:hypothetical protein